jgi:hypothetical protein
MGRDWCGYNEALVRKGELDLDFSMLGEWKRELKKASGREDRGTLPLPVSYIMPLAFVRFLFDQPYREMEGFAHFLFKFVEGLQPLVQVDVQSVRSPVDGGVSRGLGLARLEREEG